MRQIRAICALRWNYRWKGVFYWMKGRVVLPGGIGYPVLRSRGWWLVLRHPSRVIDWSGYVANGGCA